MYVGGGTFSLSRGHMKGFLKVMKILKSGSWNRDSLQADCFVFLAEYMCVGGGDNDKLLKCPNQADCEEVMPVQSLAALEL